MEEQKPNLNIHEEPRYIGVTRKVKLRRYVYWIARHTHKGDSWSVTMHEQKDAALAYDKRLISLGLEPVNVLKRAPVKAAK